MDNREKEDLSTHSLEVQRSGIENDLIEKLTGGKGKYVRFVMAVLSSIPWVGGLLSAVSGLSAEKGQEKINELQKLWIQEHKEKTEDLARTIHQVIVRLDGFGDEIEDRLQSPEYLSLVKKAFKSWDDADTQEKRELLRKLITNAAASAHLVPDDLIRLFINWINQYHETHFMVLKEIYRNPGVTRGQIWANIHGEKVPENSAEADLFKYLISELSIGHVIRQERQTDIDGNFLKTRRPRLQGVGPRATMESAFEDTKPYELTELGERFVHYVLDDVVPRIATGS
jgi:hypothetical protein